MPYPVSAVRNKGGVSDTTAPSVSTFTATSPSIALAVPITAFTASEVGASFCITESSTPPAVDDGGWSATAQTTHTVAAAGPYTLYPWVKDAAGNVSSVYGSPSSVLCVAGVTAWLVGDDVSGNDGDMVAAWVDRSGNSNNFAQSTDIKKPLLKKGVNGILGHNVLRFDGSNDILVGSNFLSGSAGTIFAVCRLSALQNYEILLASADQGTAAASVVLFYIYDASTVTNMLVYQANNNDTADTVRGSTTITANKLLLAMLQSNGTAYTMRLNQADETLTVRTGANSGDWFGDTNLRDNVTIGGAKWNAEDQFIKGDISEILIFETAISAGLIAAIEYYLASKYNSTYFTLSAPATVITSAFGAGNNPHTLSVVEHNADGFRYWGYLGLSDANGAACSLVRSNDLTTWTKHATSPVTGRWPSVVKVGSTFYMCVTKYNGGTGLNSIQLLTSPDGITFTPVKTIVAEQATYDNDGSCLFYNPNDNLFYLYWVNISASNVHIIYARSAADPADLDAAGSTIVLQSATVLAAPNMMYYGGKYYLACETLPSTTWNINIFISTGPISGFSEIAAPILTNDDACYFQHIFGGSLHVFYSERSGGAWSIAYRSATLA